jgi:tetratricopeptide (TPR) repeat protein
MKIGPVDIRIHALVYLGGIVAMIIIMFAIWRSNSVGRVETIYRSSIMLALNVDDKDVNYLEESAETCRTLIRVSPEKIAPRLYLGTILLRLNKAGEALTVFNEIEKMGSASADDKRLAQLCGGVAKFRSVAGDDATKYAGAAQEVESKFQSIVDKNAGDADALANLALARALKLQGAKSADPKAYEAIKTMCEQALSAKTPPSLSSLEQLHCLLAYIAYVRNNPMESFDNYQRAQALQPGTTMLADNQRRTMLAAILKPEMAPQLRIKWIKDVERDQNKFGQKNLPMVLNALGFARTLLKDEPDFVKVHLDAARYDFNQARIIDAKSPAPYKNMCGLLEDRIAELAKTLTVSITGISGETPQPNPWVNVEQKSLSAQEVGTINGIQGILKEEETIWSQYVDQVAQTPEEKIDGKLRQLSCLRRMRWAMPEKTGEIHLPKIATIAGELLKLGPNNPEVHFAVGQTLFEKGDKLGAFREFEAAKNCGLNTPSFNRLLNQLSGQSELIDIVPEKGGVRAFGLKPLFRATIRGIDMNTVKDFSITLDTRTVSSTRVGSQVLYVPQEVELSDGKHDLVFTASIVDSEPKTIQREFFVNKKPPAWSVTPSDPDMIATQPLWTITLDDISGIDSSSLKVILKNANGGFQKQLIAEGRYKVRSEVAKSEVGGKVDTSSFKVSTGSDIPPGDYLLEINVSNNAGIPLNDSKKYKIK